MKLDVLKMFTKFGLVGVSGAVVNIAIFSILIGMHINYISASILSFVCAVTSNFYLNFIWTFRGLAKDKSISKKYFEFFIISGINFFVNLGVLIALVEIFNTSEILAQVIGIGCASLLNFIGNYKITFKEKFTWGTQIKKCIINFLLKEKVILILFSLIIFIATYIKIMIHTDYGYFIFTNSFHNLIKEINIYHKPMYNAFKYSPVFAMFMGIFAYLPNEMGAVLWNLINFFILFIGVKLLPIKEKIIKSCILWFALIEMITSAQNFQTNMMMAGFILLFYVFLEKEKPALAALFIVFGIYIKLFAIIALPLFILYKHKTKFMFWFALWNFIGIFAPLFLISPEYLMSLYGNWWHLLTTDYNMSYGFSLMGILKTCFHFDIGKGPIMLIGLIILLVTIFYKKNYKNLHYRLFLIANILIWVIIFNHKAESPTFIIAIIGIGIWYFIQKKNTFNLFLMIFAFVLTCLSPTDIFPSYIRENYIGPYALKALPCVLIWFKMTYEMLTNNYKIKEKILESE